MAILSWVKVFQKYLHMHNQLKKLFFLLSLVFVLTFAGAPHARAATEGSGIIIGAEPTVVEELADKAESSWPWYLTRSSGLVAALVLVLLMFSGIGFITGTTYRFLEPITGWAAHRALGIVFAIAVALHVGALYFDNFVPFSLAELLIPFKSNYHPVTIWGINFGSLYVAFGILAMYLLGLIVLTSLLWIDKIPKTWKVVHTLSYLVMLFVFVHAFFLGTDLARGVLRGLWIILAALLVWASLARLWRVKTI